MKKFDLIKELNDEKVIEITTFNPGLAKIGYPHKAVLKRLYESDISVEEQEKIIRILKSLIKRGAKMKPEFVKCGCCNADLSKACELAAYTATINGKEYVFCCKSCAKEFEQEKTKSK